MNAFLYGTNRFVLFIRKSVIVKIFRSKLWKNHIWLSGGLIIFIGAAVFALMENMNTGTGESQTQVTGIFTIIYMIIVCLILSRSGLREKAKVIVLNFHQPKYRTISLEEEKCKLYVQILENTLNMTKVYLRPGLSLDELSLMTNIPKHHFSNLLNVHIGKTFYQYISEYRIREAVFRIENDDNIKIESLAYECGFNSKTSFNRYFKEVTGATPSEYRKTMIPI